MRDTLILNMNVKYEEQGSRAFYRLSEDKITLPEINRFETEYDYMATLLHEAGHATGHIDRLWRDLDGSFGSESYAKEELRAEIASAFTAQNLGLSYEQNSFMENHEAYVQSWISVLENNPNELFAAIKDAEKISDYLMEKGEFDKYLMEKKEEAFYGAIEKTVENVEKCKEVSERISGIKIEDKKEDVMKDIQKFTL